MEESNEYVHIKTTIKQGMWSVVVHDLAGAYPEHGGVLQCDQRETLGMEEGGASPSFVWLESQLVLLCCCEVFIKETVVPETRAAAGPRELPFLELAFACKVQ